MAAKIQAFKDDPKGLVRATVTNDDMSQVLYLNLSLSKQVSFRVNMRNIGRVPLELEGREPEPLREGPDMIGQTCRHRRSAFLPGLVGGPGAERPHRPAEVVTVKGEVGGRLVRLPSLAFAGASGL